MRHHLINSLFVGVGVLLSPAALAAATSPVALLDQACAKTDQIAEFSRYKDLLALVCKDGKALPAAASALDKAYRGEGEADAFTPTKIHSGEGYTEMVVVAATKFPLSLARLIKANEKGMLAGAEAGGVTVTQTLLSADAPGAESRCFSIKQDIQAEVALLTFSNEMQQKECTRVLPSNPNIGFVYRFLDSHGKNEDTKRFDQLNIDLQTDDQTTYGLSLIAVSVSNMHFPSQTEDRMAKVPPALAAAYFKSTKAD